MGAKHLSPTLWRAPAIRNLLSWSASDLNSDERSSNEVEKGIDSCDGFLN